MQESTLKPSCWKVIGISGDLSCAELSRYGHCHHCPIFASIGRSLLDRPFPEDHRHTWAAMISREKPVEDRGQILTLLIFRVGGEWLALPAGCISGVTSLRPVHSVPHLTDAVFKGIVNMDGQLMLCISLRWLVAEQAAEERSAAAAGISRMIAMSRAGRHFVLIADSILGVRTLSVKALQPPPATLQKSPTALLRSVFFVEDRTVGLFDEAKLFDTLDRKVTR